MSYLESAMRDAAVEPRDEQGLMPIAEARELVSRKRVSARGEDLQAGGRHLIRRTAAGAPGA